jgi:hypothetical protein
MTTSSNIATLIVQSASGVVAHHRNRAELTSPLPEVFICNGLHREALRQ